ncbi:MAG: tRNA (uridine(34)/cytosine(34)/5-carboxymethylaminomethyluridine(34)-2'-O)-methyltransferase TrmL [Clostridia bacterium]|nr:tRNA (uridine(34)/cytosine(34)/5-carboxymethylaminomethyluridine(34)-2'-O)-methyltransferase TrmL [Clostridia bacterium]MBO5914370.1 tRNA (uridine(34)/cytosine(34)/5-carboxymethylaminomethyluridine(34)-2'-O)-methyltransferase TrmL [Clostridia bacterium]
MLHIVLYEPEIPQNTGNISRTCAVTGAHLHLIEPLGFELSDRTIRRAGLDYWQYLTVSRYANWEEFIETNPQGEFYFCSTKGQKCHSEVEYPHDKDVYLVFGKESHGLPEPLLAENYDRCIRIPMLSFVRSLNLSNAVAICAYEVLRQLGYPNLSDEGRLTGRED